jgi:ferrochelatase
LKLNDLKIKKNMSRKTAYLLVNFGGPRNLEEIQPFLTTLLQDRDVIRTRYPPFFHNWLFKTVARKRAKKIAHDYTAIGGKSPIYFDTETIAEKLAERLDAKVLTFHRYLPATHESSLKAIEQIQADDIRVLPLFPQFSYATTGSVARFLGTNLCCKTINRLRWIKSYAAHPAFIQSYQLRITQFLKEKELTEEETILLFSAHGLPQSFICTGDLYEAECELSYRHVLKGFPKALGRLCFQSKFGPGEWLRPYTDEACEAILDWNCGRKQIVIVPLSFTSDHIETLFEIEQLYLPILRKKNLIAHRCPALNLEPYWIDHLAQIAKDESWTSTQMLIRNRSLTWCCRTH